MTTGFVLSGGASLGSVQVGMALALEEAGIEPDFLVGSSVGAINGAWLASGRSVEGLAAIWRRLQRSELFPLRPVVGLRGFVGRSSYFVPNRGLRRLLERHLDFAFLEDAPTPLTVIATDARTGEEVAIDHGPAIPALLASSAIPAVFPPVQVGGRVLIDGGIANNTPITSAIEAGATEVWVLSTGYSCALPRPPSGAIAMGLHSIALLVQQRLALETTTRQYPVPVRFIPLPCPIEVLPTDFSQSSGLIERGYEGTRRWLDDGCPVALPVGVHDHTAVATS